MFKSLFSLLLAISSFAAFAAVDANKASQPELEAVKGIGPTVAQRMLDERKKGPFADWSDMQTRVKGVGKSNASKFSAAGLTVNGTAYASAAPAVAPRAVKTAAKPAAAK